MSARKTAQRVEAWHFLANDRRFGHDDGNIAAPGYVYSVEGPIKLCEWGLHASERAIDALQYAPGNMIGRVVLSGEIIRGDDKLVATHREYLWIADAEETLRSFTRWSALQVIHLWNAPDIVRRYLESGDKSLRSAAESAAESAANLAANSAAYWAAHGAARSAAYSAANLAAYWAAYSAASSAANSAANSAAYSAQNDELEKRLFALGEAR